MPTSTAYRLATELVARRILERTDGGYRIGLRLWEVGSLSPRSSTLQEVVLPYMEDLYEATKENVHLGVLVGDEVLYVERITGTGPCRCSRGGPGGCRCTRPASARSCWRTPPTSWSTGWPATGSPASRRTPSWTPAKLRQELAEIRRTGVAYANEELTPGTLSVAAPLLDAWPRDRRALARGPVDRADVRRLGPAVQTAARAAARELWSRSS